jgi:hypothetical protein
MAVWAINTRIGLLFLFLWLQVAAAPFGTRIADSLFDISTDGKVRPNLTFVIAPPLFRAHIISIISLSPSLLSVMRTIALPPHIMGRCVMQRNRFTQTITLGDRLADEAERLRQKALTVQVGRERDSLLRKARQLETAAHVNEWLSSSGLQTPR